VKLPNFSITDLFESRQPQWVLAPATGAGARANGSHARPDRGGAMMFASGSDDDGYGGYDDDVPYEDPPQSTRRSPGARRGDSGGSGDGGSGGGGRRRSVQFQPEERYWTEYLRIALPIVGLLLMIGLFWFWASQLAGGGNDGDDPEPTNAVGAVDVITPPPSTPQPTQPPVDQPTQPPAEAPASTPADQAPVDDGAAEEVPVDDGAVEEEPAAETGGFAIGDSVLINDDGVNMRDAATTVDSTVIDTLDANAVLTIQSGPIEADGYVWWEVLVEETNEIGFVAEDFFDPS